MQPSMGTLYSSSRVVKDSTLSGRQILRCINFWDWWIFTQFIFEHGESLPSKIWSTVNREWTGVLLFSLFESEFWRRKNKSAWWIFTQLYFCGSESWPNYYRKKVNWWWILTQRFCWKGEQRWRLEVGRFKIPFDTCINSQILRGFSLSVSSGNPTLAQILMRAPRIILVSD